LTSERPAQVVADVEAALGGLGGRSVLVLGVAYKAGLSDVRNSPGIQVLEILRAHGAHARYCDPYVATVAVGGREEPSRPWSVEEVGSYDCLVLVTDHAAFVQPPVWRAARLVFDTRGCLPVTDRVRQV
jgi:UDP-N-acetyl-D-glucosamine dehydrogenase